MRSLLLTGALLAACLAPGPSKAQSTPALVSKSGCFGAFRSYDDWMQYLRRKNNLLAYVRIRLAFPREKFERYQKTLDCWYIQYRSDQHLVRGWLVQPKKGGRRLPTIVFNRGGNRGLGALTFGHLFDTLFPLAEQGYVVAASQYRGAENSQKASPSADEFGGADVRDVTNLLKLLRQNGRVDEDNIFMLGQSRGAIMTFRALLDPSVKVRAVAVHAGAYDLHELVRFRPAFEHLFATLIPDYVRNRTAELDRRSVTRWAGCLPAQTPVLMIHGEQDERAPVGSARRFAAELKRLGRVHRLVVYPGEKHSLRGRRDEVLSETLRWFRTYQHGPGQSSARRAVRGE